MAESTSLTKESAHLNNLLPSLLFLSSLKLTNKIIQSHKAANRKPFPVFN